MSSLGGQKLRLLCLHGHRQSGQLFRAKLGGFRKMVRRWFNFLKKKTIDLEIFETSVQVKKVADLDFMTAPHKIPGGEEEDFTW